MASALSEPCLREKRDLGPRGIKHPPKKRLASGPQICYLQARRVSIMYCTPGQSWQVLRSYYESAAARAIWLPEMCGFYRRRRTRSDVAVVGEVDEVVAQLLALPHTPCTGAHSTPMAFWQCAMQTEAIVNAQLPSCARIISRLQTGELAALDLRGGTGCATPPVTG